jgi:CRISPR-associated endonuclease/helicase Cas3
MFAQVSKSDQPLCVKIGRHCRSFRGRTMNDGLDFDSTFEALTGNYPFPWQSALFEQILQHEIPKRCDIPTGLGKTAIIPIWLIALAHASTKIPRRLAYVVNRRTVVDQATREAEKLQDKLREKLEELRDLIQRLEGLCAAPTKTPLAISTLRGQFADNGEWCADPARPAVIVGTVDMIGSRLLFGGYRIGFKRRPMHAGFLGQDTLIVHDEAHLEPAFQELLVEIRKEQERCDEFRSFHIMELSATSRGKEKSFEMTNEETTPPAEIPDPPKKPLHVVWQRLKAKKGIEFHKTENDKQKIADRIGELAKGYSDSHPGSTVLVYVNSLEDHATVRRALKGKQVQVLTGTIRGLERDQMADPRKKTACPIFARFLKPPKPEDGEKEQWKITPTPGTVYLVCTSAGEVGIDISADHMVCDLTTFDRMAQRFGRVNRFGAGDANIDIVYEVTPDKTKENDPNEQARWKTLELLKELPGAGERRSASPLALTQLRQRTDLKPDVGSAYTPQPTILPTSDILFDSWALTTIRDKLPGRPPVEPYLHGLEDEKNAETYIAWREEVWLLRDARLTDEQFTELLDDYPLKPHEILRDSTYRKKSGVRDRLVTLAHQNGGLPVWIQEPAGDVHATILEEAVELPLASRTVILPPEAGGLLIFDGRLVGLLDGMARYDSEHRQCYDVADEWYEDDEQQRPRRKRVWDDGHAPNGMRLIRTIDTNPDAEDEDESEDSSSARRFWRWYVKPRSADDDGSKTAQVAVEWQRHTDDVTRNVAQVVAALELAPELREAIRLAAIFHDLGKQREVWQRSIGNPNPRNWHAKSGKDPKTGKRWKPVEITDYRHEFGSLLDVQSKHEFQKLSEQMKELVLHLIAAHHGRARPHFPSDEVLDPGHSESSWHQMARTVPQRFARLQRKYGRWGLAYLESLLRAADYAASANPSELVKDDQEYEQ